MILFAGLWPFNVLPPIVAVVFVIWLAMRWQEWRDGTRDGMFGKRTDHIVRAKAAQQADYRRRTWKAREKARREAKRMGLTGEAVWEHVRAAVDNVPKPAANKED